MRPGWLSVLLASVVCVACMLFILAPAFGRDPGGRYAGSPNAAWFKSQHNAQGQWCCDEADGHPYFDEYTIDPKDGSVTVSLDGKSYKLPAYMVLKGPNPTGHAIWWYTEAGGEHRDYCFAPGSLT